MAEPTLPIIVDDRETRAGWKFDGFTSIIKRLDTGDYSLLGHESRVCIERKSKSDAWGSVGGKEGKRRDRLELEYQRMSTMDSALVIIECNLDEFVIRPPHSKMHPSAVVGTYMAWMVKYCVMTIWAPNTIHAERLAIKFLGNYLKYRVKGDGA